MYVKQPTTSPGSRERVCRSEAFFRQENAGNGVHPLGVQLVVTFTEAISSLHFPTVAQLLKWPPR